MSWLDTFLEKLDTELFTVGTTQVTPLSFVIFAITIIVALVIAKVASRGIHRYFAGKDSGEGIAHALERMVLILSLALGVVVGLENVGIDLTALAAVGAMLSVGIGFGLQGVAQNFVSGVTILIERPVQKGDFVIVGDTVGEVHTIAMRATRIITRDAITIIVPNHELMTSRVINMSRPDSVYRARIGVGVAYGSDTALVKETLLGVARENPDVLEKPEPLVLFRDFGNSSLDFELCVWLESPKKELQIQSEIRFAIDQAFRDNDITIPFPQRDLHIRSGLEPVAKLSA
jgi:small-conductance mechanosensitive channel